MVADDQCRPVAVCLFRGIVFTPLPNAHRVVRIVSPSEHSLSDEWLFEESLQTDAMGDPIWVPLNSKSIKDNILLFIGKAALMASKQSNSIDAAINCACDSLLLMYPASPPDPICFDQSE